MAEVPKMIATMLSQAAPVLQSHIGQDQGLASEVVLHPYVAVAIMGTLFVLLIAIGKWAIYQFEKRMNEKFATLESDHVEIGLREQAQDARLDKIETELRGYEKHVAVGLKETSEINEAIQRVSEHLSEHTRKEETVTWAKIDNLVATVSDMKLSNEVAHERLVAGQALLGARMDTVERRATNGHGVSKRTMVRK
jgi:hypothetical protein